MPSISRRGFLSSMATVPLALWVARNANANEPLIRHDACSAAGKEMLQVYAAAVAAMQARAPGDPLSWVWQWYTHFVDGATTKDAELARIFGSEPSPLGALAGEVWNTCQSHAGQNANNFLPWHRMYVLFFEAIIRQVSGRPDFALPYWNYTSDDPALRGVLPVEFRLPGDPVFGCLYRPDRKQAANQGLPIHTGQPGDAMDISVEMAKTAYSTSGGVQGFCRAVDSGIHGRIHALVGNRDNMGRVPYAARDPLFWVHHASIDRIWASWNLNGGVNPTTASWTSKAFVFADAAGQRVSSRLRDYFDMAALGYTYDSFIPPPAVPMAIAGTSAAIGTKPKLIARAESAELGTGPARRALRMAAGMDPVGAALARERSWLVLKDLHTWQQPDVLYHVYLISASEPEAGAARYVGAINFFDAEFHDHGDHALDQALGENFFSFEVTSILRRMYQARGRSGLRDLGVLFVPGGRAYADARPLVATIQLVQQ
jgi:hypothetical protein